MQSLISRVKPSPFRGRFCQRRRQGLCLMTALLLGLALAAPAFGQALPGSLSGSITDPGGAVIPGATVTATDQERGYDYTATSDETGRYAIRNLRPAVYKATVSVQGFKTFVRDKIEVRVGPCCKFHSRAIGPHHDTGDEAA